VRPPNSQLGPIDEAARAAVVAASPLKGKYDVAVDRESAAELLQARAAKAAEAAAAPKGPTLQIDPDEFNRARRYDPGQAAPAPKPRSSTSRSDSVTDAFAKSFARQLGTKSGQALVRGVLGSLFKGR
jgi:hypothetical protein